MTAETMMMKEMMMKEKKMTVTKVGGMISLMMKTWIEAMAKRMMTKETTMK